MKNIFKKENLMPVIVLSSICLVVAILMGVVNMFTAPRIKHNEEQKVFDSLREVLDGTFQPKELPQNAPSTVTGLYEVTDGKEFIGHVVTVEKQGYADKILMTVGIDKNGKITKVVITGQQETHGKDISPLIEGFESVTEDQVAGVDHVAGATITSGFIKEAIADAFKVITPGANNDEEEDTGSEEEKLPTSDEDLLKFASQLVGEDASFTDVTPEGGTFVKRVFRENSDNGYVVYLVVINERYNRVETETLVHISNEGKIVAVKKLAWKTSDAGYGYEPPATELVDAFYATLAGKTLADLEALLALETNDGQLVTGATSTSKAFVTSLVEGIKAVENLDTTEIPDDNEVVEPKIDNTARIIGIAALSVMVVTMAVCIVVPKTNKGGKSK